MSAVWWGYLGIWLFRLLHARRLMEAPRFHGADWFLDYRVGAGFYAGEGRTLMRLLRVRVLTPLVAEAVLGALLWWKHQWTLAYLAQAAAVSCSLFYFAAVFRVLARRAFPYAIVEESAVSTLAVSLGERKLADYTKPWLEWALRIAMAAAVLLLAVAAARAGAYLDVTRVVLIPAVALYVSLGLVLVRNALVRWRVGATPAVNPERFWEWQDLGRRTYMAGCDWLRGEAAVFLLGWSVLLNFGHTLAWRTGAVALPMFALTAVGLPPFVTGMRRFERMARALKSDVARFRHPAPRPVEGVFHMGGWVCLDREDPAMFVRGPHGRALNASARRAKLWFAYLVGWVAIAAAVAVRG